MKYGILGRSDNDYKKGIIVRIAISIAIACATVVLNGLLTVFRSESTHIAFLIINIVTDILAFGFLLFYVSTNINPRMKLYELACCEKDGQTVCGEITRIAQDAETVNGFECYEMTIQSKELYKVYLIKECGIPYNICGNVKIVLVDNIVVSAEAQA